MPIYKYECVQCERSWNEIRHVEERDDTATCTKCEAPANRSITAYGGYTGQMGASTRPKNSASFKDGEQLEFDFNKPDKE